jgi:hypothetical protein
MATLSDAQIAKFRILSGDLDDQDYAFTDADAQTEYDLAVADAALNETLNVDPLTVVYLLRRRMGKVLNDTDESGEFGNRRNSQVFTNIRDKLLPYWEGLAGLPPGGGYAAGRMTVGVLALGIDSTDEDV